MVAVIAGNGLGLDNTSLQKLGGSSGGSAQVGQGNAAGYVNLANGNLVLQGNDQGLVFAGTQLSFTRTYNSQGQLAGQDWRFGFSQSVGTATGTLDTAGSTVVRTDADGSTTTYTYDAARGVYVSQDQAGTEDTLAWSGSSAQWTWTEGSNLQHEVYNASGELISLSNTQTGASFSFSYNNGLLTQIHAADGDMLTVGYDSSGRVASLTVTATPAGGGQPVTREQVWYGYDSLGRLATVTTNLDSDSESSAAIYRTTYGYDGSSERVSSVSQSDGTVVSYGYTQDAAGDFQVSSITTGTGSAATTTSLTYASGQTTLTDGKGNAWVYALDANGNLASVTSPAVNGSSPVTSYTYDAEGNLTSAMDGGGNLTTYAYDAHGNLVQSENGAGQVVTYTYDAADQVISTTTWTVEAQGQPGDTDYVAPGGAETTYLVRDAGERVQFTIDPTGTVIQNIYGAGLNGATVLASTVAYRGVNFDTSSYSASNPPAAQDLTDWVASPAVQSKLGLMSRVDNSYSASDQLLQQISYDTVDASGVGVMDDGTVIHKTVYDAQGQLRQSIILRGEDRTVSEQTSYAYDGMGRILATTDALGNTTTYIYDDAHNGVAIYQANGLVTSKFSNSAGQLISVIQGTGTPGSGATNVVMLDETQDSGGTLVVDSTILYDSNGRVVVSIDGSNAATYTFYDAQGRVAGTVSPTGVETAYLYDAQGNRTTQTVYATAVDTSGWLNDRSLGTSYPSGLPSVGVAAGDATTRTVFDGSGHQLATVGANGMVTVNGFDANGNEVYSTVYTTALTASQMSGLGNAPTLAQIQSVVTTTSTDAITLWVYDSNGRLAATVAPNNVATQYTRDAAGNVTQQRIYFKTLTAAQRTSLGNTPTLSALQADLKTNASDQISLTLYDANERVIATVDANRNVVLFYYNGNGQLASKTVVATPLTTAQRNTLVNSPSLTTLQADINAGGTGSNYIQVYDDGNLYATVTADGQVTTYNFDYANNLTSIDVHATLLTAAQLANIGTEPSLPDIRDTVTSTPQDQITLYLRDSSSSIIATVMPVAQYTTTNGVTTMSYGGQITTLSYNQNSQVTTQTVYNTQLTAAQVAGLLANDTQSKINSTVTRSAYDQTSFWIYDDHDRLAAVGTPVNGVDGNGTQFTVYSYDTASRLLSTITHATPLTQAQAAALASNPTTNKLNSYLVSGSSDYGSVQIYDSSSRVVAVIAGGSASTEQVTLTTFDSQGRPYMVEHIGTELTAAQFDALVAAPSQATLNSTLPAAGTAVSGNAYDYITYASNGAPSTTLVSQFVDGAWQGVLTSYQYDSAGHATQVTSYTPVAGQALDTFYQAPSATSLQTLVSGATPSGSTWSVFDASGNIVATVSPTGSVQTWSYDADGRQLVDRTYGLPLTTTAMNSLGGSPTLSQVLTALPTSDPSTAIVHAYDDAGHLVASVDGSGHVTINIYDANGYLQSTTAYATALTTAQQSAITDEPTAASIQAAVSPSSSDVTNYQIHDTAGNLLATVDTLGNVAVMSYDASGHQLSKVQYAAQLTAAQMASFAQNQTLAELQALVTPGASDQITVSAYDANGYLIASAVNGAVTLITNDSDGHPLNTVAVTNHLTTAQMQELATAPSIDGILADLTIQQGNGVSQTIYDAAGNALATIGTDGHVVVMTYDADGHKMSSVDYGEPLPAGHGYYGGVAALFTDISDSGNFVSLTLYNLQGQVTASVDSSGKTTIESYNSTGQLTSTSHYDTDLTESQRSQLAAAPTLTTLDTLYDTSTGTGGDGGDGGDGGTGTGGGDVGTGTGPGGTGTAPTSGRITTILYDSLGRPAATIDPTGATSFRFYDADGRLSTTIDADGEVTGYRYDAAGQVVATTQYQATVPAATSTAWLQAGALASTFPATYTPSSSAQDRTAVSVYDEAGQVVAVVDPLGYVSTREYDGAGNVVRQTDWATPLSAQQLSALASAPSTVITPAPSAQDRTTSYFYDTDNRPVAQIDAAGYLTVNTYDTLGQIAKVVAFANAIPNAGSVSLSTSVPALQGMAGTDAGDQTTLNFYDGTGQLTASIDADRYLTTWTHDQAGNIEMVTRHAAPLTPSQVSGLTGNETSADLLAQLASIQGDQTTTTRYDADGRATQVTGADGTVTQYTYTIDATGEVDTTSTISLGKTYETSATYDSFGEKTSSTDAANLVTAQTFDADGRVTSSTNGSGNTLYYFYDAMGRVNYTIQGQPDGSGTPNQSGDVCVYAYDSFGELTSTLHHSAPLAIDHSGTVDATHFDPSVATAAQVATVAASLVGAAGDPDAQTSYAYDADGRVATIIDGDVYATTTTYDAFGEVVATQKQVSLPGQPLTVDDSRISTYQYDAVGNQVGQIDAAGTALAVTHSATYDAFGRLVTSTDGNGVTTTFSYDGLGQVVGSSITVAGHARTTQTTYDAFGRTVSQTDAMGAVTQYVYDVQARSITITTPEGVSVTTVTDILGDTVSLTNASGTTTYSYDGDGRLTGSFDALGNETFVSHDDAHGKVTITDASGNTVDTYYDADQRVLSRVVDPDGLNQTTTYQYDGAGRELSTTDANGTVTVFTYDADGRVLTQVVDPGEAGTGSSDGLYGIGPLSSDPLNLTTAWAYDGEGNVVTQTLGTGDGAVTTQYTYDALGRLAQTTQDPAGLALSTSYAYDGDGRLVSTTDPLNLVTRNVYDEAGELVYTLSPAGDDLAAVTQRWYDADGRVVATRAYASLLTPLANMADLPTDVAALASSNDQTTSFVYDADGRQRYAIDARGEVIETRYDASGRVTATLAYAQSIMVDPSVIQAGGQAAVDAVQSLLASAGDADASARANYDVYDADGRVAYVLVPTTVAGNTVLVVTGYTYDAVGRTLSTSTFDRGIALTESGNATPASIAAALAAAGATAQATSYTYDRAGRQVAVTDPNDQTTFTVYDAVGNVVATVDAIGHVTRYLRDAAGRVVAQVGVYTGANQTGYDTAQWLADENLDPDIGTYNAGYGDRFVLTSYDTAGRVSQVVTVESMGSNAQYVAAGEVTSYSYDGASRLVSATATDVSDNAVRTITYVLDADGRRTGVIDPDGFLTTFGYDGAGHVVASTTYAEQATSRSANLSLDIPADSARQSSASFYDGLGQLLGQVDAAGYLTTYAYDNDGNLQSTQRYANVVPATDRGSMADALASVQAGGHRDTSGTYDAYGELLTSTDEQGTITVHSYDQAGRTLSTTVGAGTADARTTTMVYDTRGNLVSTTDPMLAVTQFTYDAAGNRLTQTDNAGNTIWYVYDADNRLGFTIVGEPGSDGTQNAFGEVTETDHDDFGEVSQETRYAALLNMSQLASKSYSDVVDAVWDLSQQGDDQDDVMRYSYDGAGNVASTVDGSNHQNAYTYDGFGDLIKDEMPYGSGNSGGTHYAYDGRGNVIEQTEQIDEITYGCGPSGGSNTTVLRDQDWSYDAYGNRASYNDGDGNTTTYAYDELGRQIGSSQEVAGQVRQSTATYDAWGGQLTGIDAMGRETTFSYDDANRSMTVTQPDGVVTTSTYSREGQLVSITTPATGTTNYHYDADGRLLETIRADGSESSQAYDSLGNLTESIDFNGVKTDYTYDAVGRVLTQVVDPTGLNRTTTYQYNGYGAMDVEVDPTGVETSLTYDGAGRKVFETIHNPADSSDATLSEQFVYDTFNNLTTTYISDGRNGSAIYNSYDLLGRITTQAFDDGTPSISYTYDANGNVTYKAQGDSVTIYSYNEANELIYQATNPGVEGFDSAVATGAWRYSGNSYNADGQLVSTTQYANELSSGTLNEVMEGVSEPVTSADDRTSYNVYNAAGQLAYSIDPTGVVTQIVYNDAGQAAEQVNFAAPITVDAALASSMAAGSATSTDITLALSQAGANASSARTTWNFYDGLGRVQYSVSSGLVNGVSGGIVTEHDYDADGNVTAERVYATLVPLSELGTSATTATLASYLAGHAEQRSTLQWFDAAGELVYSVDPTGAVTAYTRDSDGRVLTTTTYAHAVQVGAGTSQSALVAAIVSANPGVNDVRSIRQVYDDLGRVVAVYNGASTTPTAQYTYNSSNQKVTSRDGDGNLTSYYYSNDKLIEVDGPDVANLAIDPLTGAATATIGESGYSYDHSVTQYYYDANGDVIEMSVTGSRSRAEEDVLYDYDEHGRLISQSTKYGSIVPDSGEVQNSGTTRTTTLYNSFGEVAVSVDANGNASYTAYDADGRVVDEIDANGYVTAYQYDAFGDRTSATRYAQPIDVISLLGDFGPKPLSASAIQGALLPSSQDRTITTTFDLQGNVTSVTQPSITYMKADGTTATGSPVTTYTYDIFGERTSQSVLVQGTPGQADAVWATTYTWYDNAGRALMSVDPTGYVTTTSYDATGAVASTTQYARAISTAGLTAGGSMPAVPEDGDAGTGPDRTTTTSYDSAGRILAQTSSRSYVDASGTAIHGTSTTSYVYDNAGRVVQQTQDGRTVTTTYDAAGRILSVTAPPEQVLVSNWQALLVANPSWTLDNPALYTSASQVMTYQYDVFGNKVVQTQSSTAGGPSVATYSLYDDSNRLVASAVSPDGQPINWSTEKDDTRYTYDAAGNQTSITTILSDVNGQASTVVTTTTYDAAGQQLSTQTVRGTQAEAGSSKTYDAFGEVVTAGDTVNVISSATFDAAGNQITAIDPKTGVTHHYAYNLAGQLVRDTHPVDGGTVYTGYTLDLDGRVTSEVAPATNAATGENPAITASYDRWGNLLSSTDANGGVTTYTYNELNQLTSQSGPAVDVVDEYGQLTTQAPTKTYGYDLNDTLIRTVDEDGHVTLNTYDSLDQVTSTVDGVGNTSLVAYDSLGNAVAAQDGLGHITFTQFNAKGQVTAQGDFGAAAGTLVETVQEFYVLDQAGNRITTYDAIGYTALQSGDAKAAMLHANFDGYDSQGRIIWTQTGAQRAVSEAGAVVPIQTNPTNASFDDADPSSGWTADPGFYFGPFGETGGGAQFINPGNEFDNSGNLINQNQVPVVAGQTITASLRFGQGTADAGDAGGTAIIAWYDANHELIGYSTGTFDGSGSGFDTLSVTGTALQGAAYAAIGVNCHNTTGDPITLDSFQWNYVPDPSLVNTGANYFSQPSGSSFTLQPSNSNFENGDTGWDKDPGWTIGVANGDNGPAVAQFNGNGQGTLTNQDKVPVIPGQEITASISISLNKPDGAELGGQVLVIWYDANGNELSFSAGNLINDGNGGAYVTSTVSANAPPGAAFAVFAVSAKTNGEGQVLVDSASWNYVYQPTTATGQIQTSYGYDIDGRLVSESDADNSTTDNGSQQETWTYDAYGRVQTHTDLSGASYSYTYDPTTGLQTGEHDNWNPTSADQSLPGFVTPPGSDGNTTTTSYNANGSIASVSYSDGSSYTYSHDANGNQTRQEAITHDGAGLAVHTITTSTYDSHNRVTGTVVTNGSGAVQMTETYSYDAAGNRREVTATSATGSQDAWYTYDGDNRVVVSNGKVVNGQIIVTDAPNSYSNAYDAAGNVIYQRTATGTGDVLQQANIYDLRGELLQANYTVDVTTGSVSKGVEELRTYDAVGHLISDVQYYAIGTTIDDVGTGKPDPNDPGHTLGESSIDVGGDVSTATFDTYDAVGRLAREATYGHASGWDGTGGDSTVPATPPTQSQATWGSLSLQSTVQYVGPDGVAGYDAEGNVVAYQYLSGGGRVDQYQVTYLMKDGYLESTTTGT
ncbi:MAG TPA: DUF6531 domain-containing protein, partial [Pinirhizobacter sp.]